MAKLFMQSMANSQGVGVIQLQMDGFDGTIILKTNLPMLQIIGLNGFGMIVGEKTDIHWHVWNQGNIPTIMPGIMKVGGNFHTQLLQKDIRICHGQVFML